jgi:hypothetical protein
MSSEGSAPAGSQPLTAGPGVCAAGVGDGAGIVGEAAGADGVGVETCDGIGEADGELTHAATSVAVTARMPSRPPGRLRLGARVVIEHLLSRLMR